jgi:methionyl-tRNA synthetase
MKRFYITTAIDYANGAPHLGHASEKTLTDVIARYKRHMGVPVHFLTGLDEHGTKVQQSAQKKGVSPQQFVDEVAPKFLALCSKLNISNDDFIRTTEPRHVKIVQECLQKLFDKGEIYKGEYKGYYSVRQEQFVTEKERLPDGSWPEVYGQVTEITEPNYYFKLSKYQDWLLEFLKNNDFVFPKFRQKQVVEFLKEPINDLCISRPKNRLEWGIELPFDKDFVTYVWFDALVNYASAVGMFQPGFEDCWPADWHVIGKDILVPAHAVYWPIMLKALDIPLPKGLLVHGWWHISGQKMSKSTGNTVDPMEIATQFSPDALRYFLTREMNVGQDADFNFDVFMARYNGDLANDLGNLVSRLLNMTGKSFPDGLPGASVDGDQEQILQDLWTATKKDVLDMFENMAFHTALEKTFAFVTAINRYAEQRAPWKLAKNEDDRLLYETSLATMAEGLRLATALLAPVMPDTSNKIYALLGLGEVGLWKDELDWGKRLKGNVLGKKTILFPKPEVKAEPKSE